MNALPIVEKVGAFILRQGRDGLDELLLFRHADFPDVPAQIPGGTVETGRETIEEALHREVREESGLSELPIVRSLGLWDWLWPEKQILVKDHPFVLRAPVSTPDTWTHLVEGTGEDARLRFDYFWVRPTAAFRLGPRIDRFLNSSHMPELYP
jgi:8-oxo-dGTP pyrophosphatase MutT (NUDIX family)